MEKENTPQSTKVNENLNLVNRNQLKMDGVIEVLTSNDTTLVLKLKDTTLTISGKDLTITKLDVTTGTLESNGTIDSVKYGQKGNLFKRIFRWKYPTFFNWKTFCQY